MLAAMISAIALSGCGSSGESNTRVACVILANGNKLCGADARAYCNRFVPAQPDPQTAAACASVGAARPSAPGGGGAPDETHVERVVRVAETIRPTLQRVLGARLRSVDATGDGTLHIRTSYTRYSDAIVPRITAACRAIQPAITGVNLVQIEAQDGSSLQPC
jgi:hypothetical protein